MQVNEELIKKVIAEVLQEVMGEQAKTSSPTATLPQRGGKMTLVEVGVAKKGTDPKEVVVAIPPAFGTVFTETIVAVPHSEVLRQVFAGIEEEGLKPRLVRVYHTADVGFIAHQGAKLSGSGIGIGILSRGTTVIHQRDLNPLNNLELFPQAPLLDAEVFRAIGRNAAKYAKGEHPTPVPTRNDPMARPRYQGIAALLHNKEVRYLDRSKSPMELEVRFE
ncbi:propanediol/glycerol family dehydratase medium subunit [Acetomicrobium sp.]|uniref:propanediol/glycerol family dehydratase medium subunit n=1 Tax=Acetomicrobium sp. TaxID=1872099 RepID=UPI001BCC7D28|nr:propanediol/glycerol family dehydratase medium subunit [Acetomicrobium sp.]